MTATGTRAKASGTFPARASRSVATDLLELARTTRAIDPRVLDERELFFFSAVVSNDKLDAYGTRMAESSLRNYAEDFTAGLSFQDAHRVDGLERTLGQSLRGTYARKQVEVDFYTLRGVSGQIDAWIDLARGGVARDVSITFFGGEYRCSICGNDMLSFECEHWPGVYYTPEGGRRQMAVAWVENAHASEASNVYDGATPGAMLTKAHRMIADRRMRPDTVALLEQTWRVRLPTPTRLYVPGRPTQEGRMDPNARPPAGTTDDDDEQLDDQLEGEGDGDVAEGAAGEGGGGEAGGGQAGAGPGGVGTEGAGAPPATPPAPAPAPAVPPPAPAPAAGQNAGPQTAAAHARLVRRALSDAVEVEGDDVVAAVHKLAREVKRLRPLADQGRAYREALIAETLEEGTRALGAAFPVEQTRTMLERSTLDEIRATKAGYAASAASRLPGGRLTADGPATNGRPVARVIPDDAYRV